MDGATLRVGYASVSCESKTLKLVHGLHSGCFYIMCDLCATRWLFVLATGRSGSTTIFEMLNRMPGMQIQGESDGAVGSAMQTFDLMLFRGRVGSGPHAKRPPVDAHALSCNIQSLFSSTTRANANNLTLGFKEVIAKVLLAAGTGDARTDHLRPIAAFSQGRQGNDVAALQRFFARVFPCARFIFNTRRDVRNQSRSGFWRLVPGAEAYLYNQSRELWHWHQTLELSDRSFWLELFPGGFEQAALDRLPPWLLATASKAKHTNVAKAVVDFSPDRPNSELPARTNS